MPRGDQGRWLRPGHYRYRVIPAAPAPGWQVQRFERLDAGAAQNLEIYQTEQEAEASVRRLLANEDASAEVNDE